MSSGSHDNRTHEWANPATYHVEVKVKDEYGGESDFSPVFPIVISVKIP